MKSAGNDIVALTAVDLQRSVSPNFHSKFIISAEQVLYEQSSVKKTVSFCSFVWLLWSVKESAYKYFKRLRPELIFSPSKFVVEDIATSTDFISGVVLFQDMKLYYRSWITDEYISTVVNSEELFENVYHEVIKIVNADSENQSIAVRQLVLQKLRAILKLDDIAVSKTDTGYPIVMQGTTQLDIAISFAHHDLFVGYSFKI